MNKLTITNLIDNKEYTFFTNKSLDIMNKNIKKRVFKFIQLTCKNLGICIYNVNIQILTDNNKTFNF